MDVIDCNWFLKHLKPNSLFQNDAWKGISSTADECQQEIPAAFEEHCWLRQFSFGKTTSHLTDHLIYRSETTITLIESIAYEKQCKA